MANTLNFWPERLLSDDVPGPLEVFNGEAVRLRNARSDLQVSVSEPREGARTPEGWATRRIDLSVNAIDLATVEYPGRGYPALLVTGQEPHWRYHRIVDPEQLASTLKMELTEDDRLVQFFR